MASGLTHLISHPVVLLSAAAVHQVPSLLDYAASFQESGVSNFPAHVSCNINDVGHWNGTCTLYAVSAGFVFFGALLPIIVAVVYKRKVTNKRKPFQTVQATVPHLQTKSGFRFGLFDCFEDCNACLHGFCCSYVRVADTHSTAGVMAFWLVIFTPLIVTLCVAVIEVIAQLLGTTGANNYSGLVSVLVAVIFGGKRVELRKKMGHAEVGCSEAMLDVLTWWCCGCCATIQEARSVDAVQGEEVRCCCALTQVAASESPFLGRAVQEA